MKNKASIVLLFLIISGPFEGMGKLPFRKGAILETAVVSFLIGNTIAWASGAYPRTFEKIPYSENSKSVIQDFQDFLEENPEDSVILTEYGGMLSSHNEIESAEEKLEKALSVDPDSSITKAWLASNRFKQTGASIDLLFGLVKLYELGENEDQMNEAVKSDPENPIVRIIRLNTYAEIGSRIDVFDKMCGEEEKLFPAAQESPELENAAFLALAAYYSANPECNSKQENLTLAQNYFAKVSPDPERNDTKLAIENVQNRIRELGEN